MGALLGLIVGHLIDFDGGMVLGREGSVYIIGKGGVVHGGHVRGEGVCHVLVSLGLHAKGCVPA